MDLDDGLPKFFPTEYLWYNPGSLALQETFSCISKLTGTVLFWCSSGSNSSMRSKRYELCGEHDYVCSSTKIDVPRFFVSYRRKALEIPEFFNKFSRFAIKQLLGKAKDLEFVPAVALAGSLVHHHLTICELFVLVLSYVLYKMMNT
ncbi:hypothetical protein HanPI659440_Chr12g0448611 [Helianthus annuus]|nr:hypothetical protein HanPI659440_Chr12g0448611 [Helianthus annuus]